MGGPCDKVMAGMEGAAGGAFGPCNGQREARFEGDRREEKIQVERMEGAQGGAGQT